MLRRSRRGVAVVATVLLTTMAVAITLVIVSQALSATRTEALRVQVAQARADMVEVRAAFERELVTDPDFYMRHVFEFERARVCVLDDGQVVEPGLPWPDECGPIWEYVMAVDRSNVRVEVSPPTPDDPALEMRLLADGGDLEVGQTARYLPDTLARYTLGSSTAADLTASGFDVLGEVHAQETLTFDPTVSGLTATASAFNPDPDLSGASSDPQNRFLLTGATGSPSVLSTSSLRSSYPALRALACNAAPLSNRDGYSTQVCIEPGGTVVSASGATVDVPPGVRHVLVLSPGNDAGTLDVYVRLSEFDHPTECAGSPCNLAAESAVALGANNHPGSLDAWSYLATVLPPATGVVWSATDTTVGLCGASFTSGTCTSWTPGTSAMTFNRSLTIVAGSPSAPASIYLGGSTLTDGAAVGFVATRDVVVPYWSRPHGEPLRVEAHLAALGYATPSTAIRFEPATATSPERSSMLDVTGSWIATTLPTTELGAFTDVRLRPGPSWWMAPPAFVSGTGAWRSPEISPLSALDVCGSALCDAF